MVVPVLSHYGIVPSIYRIRKRDIPKLGPGVVEIAQDHL